MCAKKLGKRHLRIESLEHRLVLSTVTPVSTTSTNWSGYAVETSLTSPQSNAVTSVSGAWKVPTVTATSSKSTAYCSVWVGIDGYSSSTVEQLGTDSDIVNGKAEYYVWYEMYPSASKDVTSMTIAAGDAITASVQYITSGTHAGQFLLSISDTTRTNDSFSIYQTLSSAKRSSAEWVVEAPSSNSGVLPLAAFSTVTFTNATVTINGTTGAIDSSAWQCAKINMVSGSTSEDTTSSLTDSGAKSSFTVTYNTVTATTTPTSPQRGGWGSWFTWDWYTSLTSGFGDGNSASSSYRSQLQTSKSNKVADQIFASTELLHLFDSLALKDLANDLA
jgi:hypothetical protein